MPDNNIIVRPGAVDLRLVGIRIEDFPNTGTYIAIEKVSPRSVHQEAQKGTSTSIRMSGKSYRITTTIVQFSPADRFMFDTMIFLTETDFAVSLTLNAQGMKYASGSVDGETEATRELAGDSSPNVVYTWVGSFQTAKPGIFAPPELATASMINNFSQ